MNCLNDLKEALIKQNQKITEFSGYQLIYNGSVYTMSHGEFYENNIPILEKELISKLKLKG